MNHWQNRLPSFAKHKSKPQPRQLLKRLPRRRKRPPRRPRRSRRFGFQPKFDRRQLMALTYPDLALDTLYAMGVSVAICTDADETARIAARHTIDDLEGKWSRFIESSEISVVNGAPGPVVVSTATAEVVELSLTGWLKTGGWYDPTIGLHLRHAGYDRPLVEGWSARCTDALPNPPDAHSVLADVESGLVYVPEGLAIDLGGVGKGRAADLVAADLRKAGARIAAVSVGGDVRVAGDKPCVVPLEYPLDTKSGPPAELWLRDAGVAVSGPIWRGTGDGRHHLIDPFTGLPAAEPRIAIVVARSAAIAEMLATAAAIAPVQVALEFLASIDARGWLIELDGQVLEFGGPRDLVAEPGWLDERLS